MGRNSFYPSLLEKDLWISFVHRSFFRFYQSMDEPLSTCIHRNIQVSFSHFYQSILKLNLSPIHLYLTLEILPHHE
jgi:hypothetical protein